MFRRSLRLLIPHTAPAVHVIITGGAGFIGSHLAGHLLGRGDRVSVIDNFDPFYPPAAKRRNLAIHLRDRNFRLLEASLLNVRPLEAELRGTADVLVHLAARPGIPASIDDPLLSARVNVEGTSAALELARRLGVRRFVFGSSSSVYGSEARVPFSEEDPAGRPISPYAATKRAGELLCHAHHHVHGLSVVCLRLFTVYGPRQRPDLAIHRFARLLASGEPLPLYGGGSTERDYTHIDDVLRGIEGAIDHTGRPDAGFELVNLGGGRPVPLGRVVELLGDALGVRPRTRPLPERPGDLPRTWADIRRAEELFGYRPTVSVEEGIPGFVEWLRGEEEL